jgi:hypothetical protein
MKKNIISEQFRSKMRKLSGVITEEQKDRIDFLKKQWDQYFDFILDKFEKEKSFSLNVKKRIFDRDTKQLITTGDLAHLLTPKNLSNKEKFKKLTDEIFSKIVAADPNPDKYKFFVSWLCDIFKSNKLKIEDLYKATEYLILFEKVKHLLPLEKRNIDNYVDISDLYKQIKPYEKKEIVSKTELEKEEKLKGADKVFNGTKWMIIIPKTKEGSCLYGKGTKWCTAANSNNYFDHYNKQGPLYILINKQDPSEKYQFHFESSQFMDTSDSSIQIGDFLRENEDVTQFFKSIGKINNAFLMKHQAFPKEEALKILTNPIEQSSLIKTNGLSWFFNYFIKLGEPSLLNSVISKYDFLNSLIKSKSDKGNPVLDLFKMYNGNDSKDKEILKQGSVDFVDSIVNDPKKRELMTKYFIDTADELSKSSKTTNTESLSEPMKTFTKSSKLGFEYIYSLIRINGPIYQKTVVDNKDYSSYLTMLSFFEVFENRLNEDGKKLLGDPAFKKAFIEQHSKEIYDLVFDMFV